MTIFARFESNRRGLILALVLIIAVAGAATAWWVRAGDGDLDEGVAFKYDSRSVTVSELDRRVRVLSALYGVTKPEAADELDEFNRAAAKSMVVSLLLSDAAETQGVVVSDKEANSVLASQIESQLAGDREQFTQFLANAGISEGDVLEEIKRQLATSKLAEKVTAPAEEPTEEQLKQAYASNKDSMVSPEVRHLLNIVVETRADADRVAELAGSVDFARLARTWSLDDSTRGQGGDIGNLAQVQLETDFGREAFSVGKGDVFGPVKTTSGWNVGKVVEIVPEQRLAFATVKATLKQQLLTAAQLELWRSFLGDLLKSDVVYAAAYRPADPGALPSDVLDAVTTESPSPATP